MIIFNSAVLPTDNSLPFVETDSFWLSITIINETELDTLLQLEVCFGSFLSLKYICGIMITFVRNGPDEPISNPARDCSAFPFRQRLLRKAWTHIFSPYLNSIFIKIIPIYGCNVFFPGRFHRFSVIIEWWLRQVLDNCWLQSSFLDQKCLLIHSLLDEMLNLCQIVFLLINNFFETIFDK